MLSEDLVVALAASRAILRRSFPWWLRPFLARDVLAITLGRRVYVAERAGDSHLERVLRHELVHVEQVTRLGIIAFYASYIRQYVANRLDGMAPGKAYRNISFEVEAYDAEEGRVRDV